MHPRLTHTAGGVPRSPAIANVLRHFDFDHLAGFLKEVSQPCAELAIKMADMLPEGPDLTFALRELLAAKDNFVRARLGPL